jgi:hypothetical protein
MRFELPTSITPSVLSDKVMNALPGDVSKGLTDASHTAVGFATMAMKRANDNRLDVNAKFEPQVRELRKSALGAIKAVRVVRERVETTIDPLFDRAVERFPEAVQDTVAELRKVSRQAAATAESRMVEAIEFVTAIPTKAVRRTTTKSTPVVKTVKAAKKTVASKKTAVASSVKTVAAKTGAVKTVAAKTGAVKTVAAKTIAAKPATRVARSSKVAKPVSPARTVRSAAVKPEVKKVAA